MDVTELNALPAHDFQTVLRGLWEHSPWIVDAAEARRPYRSRAELGAAMWQAVSTASEERQLALLRAHPDLGGRLARARDLTAESAGEQASLGLDRLDDEEFTAFHALNTSYRERFGFPFIICVREHSKASIRAAFEQRLEHTRPQELENALDEVRRIAEYRLQDLVSS